MTNHLRALLNDQPCLAAEFHHRVGAVPSVAHVTMKGGQTRDLPRRGVTLTLADDRSSVTARSLRVTGIEEDGELAVVHLADRRLDWRARVDGEREGQTLAELVRELLLALGEGPTLAGLKRGAEKTAFQRWSDTPAAEALTNLLTQFGQCFEVDPDGLLAAKALDGDTPDGPFVLDCRNERVEAPGALRVIAGEAYEESGVEGAWEPVCEDEAGALRPLAEVLAEWGMDDAAVRSACLYEGGLRAIATGDDDAQKARRAALLERHAYRSYRLPLPARADLPLAAALLDDSGTARPPRVEHTGFRPRERAVHDLGDPFEAQTTLAPDTRGFVFDGATGVLTFAEVVGHLQAVTPPVHDTRLEGRTLASAPAIRLTTLRRIKRRSAFDRVLGAGTRTLAVRRGELRARFTATQTGKDPANAASLREAATDLHRRMEAALPRRRVTALLAGARVLHPGINGETRIVCDDQGLLTHVLPARDPSALLARAFDTPSFGLPTVFAASGHGPLQPRHINAYRVGPLILRASGTAASEESHVAAEATGYDAATDRLSVDHLAPLRPPFHLANVDPAKAGGWFLAAPVRLTPEGVKLLHDAGETSADYAAQSASPLGGGVLPEGTEGLLLQALDGASFLALFDRPLVAQHRGNGLTDYSIEVRDAALDALDAGKRGGLHFPLVVSLSPAHQAAGVGGAEGDRGWAPTLNLKDFTTGTLNDAKRAGRGLFTEGAGFALGRLAHLPRQGGPLMADAASCTKHRYGQVTGDDGTYTESAGHISTDAFFKISGDATFDAPLAFTPEQTQVSVPGGPEHLAEIKLHSDMTHPWNGTTREHRWVVTYRWPLFDIVPEQWRPKERPPFVMERNLALPSLDIVPPPSGGEPPEPINYPGPTLKVVAYAPEVEGEPDPELGGGGVVLPGDVDLQDGSPWDSAGPKRFLVLHPKVGLGFGLPRTDGDGEPVDGFKLCLDDLKNLELWPTDAVGGFDPGKKFKFLGPASFATGVEGPESGIFGHWQRSGTTIEPTAAGDSLRIDGRVGIGAAPGAAFKIDVAETLTPGGGSGDARVSLRFGLTDGGGTYGNVSGINGNIVGAGGGTVNDLNASQLNINITDLASVVGGVFGQRANITVNDASLSMSGPVVGLYAPAMAITAGTVGHAYGGYFVEPTVGGTVTNNAGALGIHGDALFTKGGSAIKFMSGSSVFNTATPDATISRTGTSALTIGNNAGGVGGLTCGALASNTHSARATNTYTLGTESLAWLRVFGSAGSQTAPTFTFSIDSDTGMYRPGADQLRLATGGTARLHIANDRVQPLQPLLGVDGSAAAPGLSFSNEPDTGFYNYTDGGAINSIGIALGGANRGILGASFLFTPAGGFDVTAQGDIDLTTEGGDFKVEADGEVRFDAGTGGPGSGGFTVFAEDDIYLETLGEGVTLAAGKHVALETPRVVLRGGSFQTTDDAPHYHDLYTLEADEAAVLTVSVVGIKDDGSETASRVIVATAAKDGASDAVLKCQGSLAECLDELSGVNIALDVNGDTVRAAVTGLAGTTINWAVSPASVTSAA